MNPQDARELVLRSLLEIAPELEPSEIPDDADLRTFVDLDSMDIFNLVAALSDESGHDIPDDAIPGLTTVDLFVAYLSAPDRGAGQAS